MGEIRHAKKSSARHHRRSARIDDWVPRPALARSIHLAVNVLPSLIAAATAIAISHIPLAEHRWWRVMAWLVTVIGCASLAGIGSHVMLRRLRPLADLIESGGSGIPFSASHASVKVLIWPSKPEHFVRVSLADDLIQAMQDEARWPTARSMRRRREAIMVLVGKELGLSVRHLGALPVASRLYDLPTGSRSTTVDDRINQLWSCLSDSEPTPTDLTLSQLTQGCSALAQRLDDEAIAAPSGIVRNALGMIIADGGYLIHPDVVDALRTARVSRLTELFRQHRHIAPAQRTLIRSVLSALLAVGTLSVMNLPSPVNASTPTPPPVEISSTVTP